MGERRDKLTEGMCANAAVGEDPQRQYRSEVISDDHGWDCLHEHRRCACQGNHERHDGDVQRSSTSDEVEPNHELKLKSRRRLDTNWHWLRLGVCSYDTISLDRRENNCRLGLETGTIRIQTPRGRNRGTDGVTGRRATSPTR